MKKLLSGSVIGFSALASVASSGNNPEANTKPNVILVITDDQGYGDMSCHGNPFIKTAQIDKLYNENVRLTNFLVDPVSSPTRAALYTGKYATRTGVWRTMC